MIKEILEEKINSNFDSIINEIANYSGEEYREDILKEAKNVKISIVRDSGVYSYDDGEIYVGDEPVCVKEKEGAHILMPVYQLGGASGNVIFVHLLLHALMKEPFIRENDDVFNETIVDYMANEISKKLEEKGIDITLVDSPLYESNSFYSTLFLDVEKFYRENKGEIIAARMGKEISFNDEEVGFYITSFQEKVDKLFCEPISKEEKLGTRKR